MRTSNRGLLWVTCGLLVLGLTISVVAQDGSAASQTQRTTSSQPASVLASAELPDSPGATQAQSQNSTPQQNNSTEPAGQAGAQPAGQNNATQDQRTQRPVGTAAAEAPKVSGITAAEPAGVAIAPAKQHRARAIVIKVGAIIAAGAAVGGVVALTKATPSKPPGAH